MLSTPLLTSPSRCPTPHLTLLISTPRLPHPQRPAEASPRNVALATALTAGRKHHSSAGSPGHLRTPWGLSWGERGQAHPWEIIGALARPTALPVPPKWTAIGPSVRHMAVIPASGYQVSPHLPAWSSVSLPSDIRGHQMVLTCFLVHQLVSPSLQTKGLDL